MSEFEKVNDSENPRTFKIEKIPYKERLIKVAFLETTPAYQDNPTIVPANWDNQLKQEIQQSSLTFLEYFPPELDRTIFNNPLLGNIAKSYANLENIDLVYRKLANMAHESGKPIAVADIANNARYLFYEFGFAVLPILGIMLGSREFTAATGAYSLTKLYENTLIQGVKKPTVTQLEKFIPDATDARRQFTARGILQEADRLIPGSELLYVGAPAHSARISKMVKDGPHFLDNAKFNLYKTSMLGLDSSVRIYRPSSTGWQLSSSIKTQ